MVDLKNSNECVDTLNSKCLLAASTNNTVWTADSSNNFCSNWLNFIQMIKVTTKFKGLSKVAAELRAAIHATASFFAHGAQQRMGQMRPIRLRSRSCQALPEDKAEAVRSVRAGPALRSWRPAASGAATEQ